MVAVFVDREVEGVDVRVLIERWAQLQAGTAQIRFPQMKNIIVERDVV